VKWQKQSEKIKKGIQKHPTDPDNWIIWGVILRYHGSYQSAKHKFSKALKIDRNNETAKQELKAINRIIMLDNAIPIEAIPGNKRSNPKQGSEVDQKGQNCRVFNF